MESQYYYDKPRWNLQQTFQNLTVRKYNLPDKNVASQVLMYRQLLHTKCRSGLKLSRDFQGTPAQVAVQDMPWWVPGMKETRKMIISYENLIQRLWLAGGIYAYHDTETYLDDDGKPPIPHEYWVKRLGFQQEDPVTDFRSGGVLSLACLVHVVEGCPETHQRFVESVLPFGITSINVTDMLSNFFMLAKKVDRMDALLSQKPFWQMFSDPSALLVCHQVALDILLDVVAEINQERAIKSEPSVTVFDFAVILEITTRRFEYDILGNGPRSVDELRRLYQQNQRKYQQQLETRLSKLRGDSVNTTATNGVSVDLRAQVTQQASQVGSQVWNSVNGLQGKLLDRFKKKKGNEVSQVEEEEITITPTTGSTTGTLVELPVKQSSVVETTETSFPIPSTTTTGDHDDDTPTEEANSIPAEATVLENNFSIDEEEDDML